MGGWGHSCPRKRWLSLTKAPRGEEEGTVGDRDSQDRVQRLKAVAAVNVHLGTRQGQERRQERNKGLQHAESLEGGGAPVSPTPLPRSPSASFLPASPKIPGSLWVCGSSLVLFGCLLFRGLRARGVRPGLGLALKNVTMKGWRERGARCPSSPARPGSTLSPETESREGRSWVPALPQMHLEAKGQVPPPAQPRFPHLQP